MSGSNTKIYRATIYARLSHSDNNPLEDGDVAGTGKSESNSIVNQKELIMEFLKAKPDIQVWSVHVDDGYSGVDFDRPGFCAMMEEIKGGEVDCVIVKDLSRFGRNYIESGRYIEKIFPMLGVRFIAVNDNIDTGAENSQAGDIIVPFKNLINDAYCRDISIKIRSHLEVKRKKGLYIGAFAVYGYVKSQQNKNQLVVDPYAASVVQDIFAWKLEGKSQQTIANELNASGILSPMEYKRSCGMAFETSFKTKQQALWTPVSVGRVLKNATYTGVLLQGKESTPNYKIKKRVQKSEAEWIRVEGAHEPIISQKDFNCVQQLLKRDTRTSPKEEAVFPLAGLFYCGDCGKSMVRKTVPSGDKQYVYFVCSGNKKNKSCSSHRVREDDIINSVFLTLREHINQTLSMEKVLQFIEELPKNQAEVKKYKERIEKKQEERERAERLKLNLYEDLHDLIVTKQEYIQLKQEFDQRIEEADQCIQKYQEEMENCMQGKGKKQEWMEHFKEFKNISELSRNAAVILIDKVLAYEDARIEVIFQFADEFMRCQDILEQNVEMQWEVV